ncbi:large neutral amino acids transporter small subunit 2-like [Ylistrum balloti]|uniref:large neutral amino acids transporter small subunit 2-like n=1 Tax=Ylistrum balloti TaxID=509963 RepID=UPI00290587B9|nr:large neutral amino acids transporter small subunit 2-like [Ylistrum balloti]
MEQDKSESRSGVIVVTDVDHLQMKKSISLLHCTAILISVTGHISIFITPTAIFQYTESVGLSLLIWCIGGLINTGVCLCFTEMGTIYPKAGGGYAYVLKVFGDLPGFMIMYGYILMICCPFWAFVAYIASLYTLQPILGCRPSEAAVKLLASWILVTLVALNCVYMKYVTKVQTFLSITKILALLIIITGGIVRLTQGETEYLDNAFPSTAESLKLGNLGMAMFFSIFTYGGWQVLGSLMEEVRDPGKDAPRSVYLSFAVIILKYILTNLAYFIVLSPQQILQTDAIAVIFTDMLYPPMTPVITILVGVSCVGVLNASIMGHSRILFAGARNGHAPMILSTLHIRFLTPWAAIIVMSAWALVMLVTGGLTTFMEFIQVFSTILSIFVISAQLYLRKTQPDINRPFKANLVMAVTVLAVNVMLLIICVIAAPSRIGLGIVVWFTSLPVYAVFVKWTSKPKGFHKLMAKITNSLQKALVLGKSA